MLTTQHFLLVISPPLTRSLRASTFFSKYTGLKLNTSKYEICGIGVKNNVPVALCGFKNVILTDDSIRVLGIHFSYNNNLYLERNFLDVIKNLETVLKIWKSRGLSLLGKIVIFKTLAISKIIFVSYLTTVPSDVIHTLNNIHKNFVCDGKMPKIKHSTLIKDYPDGGLKDINISSI